MFNVTIRFLHIYHLKQSLERKATFIVTYFNPDLIRGNKPIVQGQLLKSKKL